MLYPLSYEGGVGSLTPRVSRRWLLRWPGWMHGTALVEHRTRSCPYVPIWASVVSRRSLEIDAWRWSTSRLSCSSSSSLTWVFNGMTRQPLGQVNRLIATTVRRARVR